MTHRAITLAAAAAFGIGTIFGTASYAAGPTGTAGTPGSSMTGTSGTSGTGATGNNATPNYNPGPIGGEFAMNGSGGDLQQAFQSANSPDKFFLVCAAIDNQAEQQLAQIAQQKSQDPQVKQIAQKIVQDHQQAQSELQTAAQEAGVQLPHSLPMMKQQEMKMFESLSGKQFDQQYISCTRAAHAMAVDRYQDVSQTAQDSHIKDYASKALPAIQQHFQELQQTASAVGLSSGNEAQPAGAKMSGESGSNSINQMSSPGRMNQNGK